MAKAKDLLGKTFGRLTAVRVVGKDNFGRNKWEFICSCGNTTIASANNVVTGTTKSCGCLKSNPHRRTDMVGKVIGNLTVVKYAETRRGQAFWDCLCNCGCITTVSYVHLSRAHTKSCGCLQKGARNKEGNNENCAKWSRKLRAIFNECTNCGGTEQLHAHHIKPYATHKELRNDYTNGVILCKKCHYNFHSIYGKTNAGPEQLGEYLGMSKLATQALVCINGYASKSGAEDILKAIHYCHLILQLQYKLKGETNET